MRLHMDRLSRKRRSWNMARIGGMNTAPEKRVQSLLRGIGLRFTLHARRLPGIPDIVLRRHKTVVFVHGCFWHRHARCRFAYTPKSRRAFWSRKFRQNRTRDRIVRKELRRLGWRVVVVWECSLRRPAVLVRRFYRCFKAVTSQSRGMCVTSTRRTPSAARKARRGRSRNSGQK